WADLPQRITGATAEKPAIQRPLRLLVAKQRISLPQTPPVPLPAEAAKSGPAAVPPPKIASGPAILLTGSSILAVRRKPVHRLYPPNPPILKRVVLDNCSTLYSRTSRELTRSTVQISPLTSK